MKVVINACYGGFNLSPKALLRMYELGCRDIACHVDEYWPPEERAENDEKYPTMGYAHALKEWREYLAAPANRQQARVFLTTFSPDEQYVLEYASSSDLPRNDPILVQVMEELGDAASGACASLRVVEIPDGVEYEICEYDGNEHIAEKHSTWR
jgi:hypothetical protein